MKHIYTVKARTIKTVAIALMTAMSCLLIWRGIRSFDDIETAAPAQDGLPLSAIMYHSVLKDPKSAGKYVVSPDTFYADLLYLKEHGYETVFAEEIAEYALNGAALPEKPVLITLDDGYLNNLTYVLPILEELDMKATISIVGAYSQNYTENPDPNPAYANMTWDDIKTLYDSGRVEIANHSYNLHSTDVRAGCSIKRGEQALEYQTMLHDDLKKLQDILQTHLGTAPKVFTYPYGIYCDESYDVLRDLGFKVALTCDERVNYITNDASSLYSLGRFNRPSGESTEAFMARVLP